MNKAYSNIKPNIYIETSGIYSMACALSEICPVDAVIISDLPSGKFNLSVALSCEYKGKTVFSYDEKTFYDIETLLFAKKDNHSLLIRFDYKDFDINYDFLKSTDSSTNCAVKAVIKVDGTEYFADSAISVLPKNVWNGTEIHPETLCAFCMPDSKFIKAITENVKPSGRFPAYETVVENVRNIVKNMRSRNVICAKRESYSPEKKQTVNVSDVSLLDGTVVCTPLELAVIFVSCMERFLLPGEIVFVKNTAGITNVFCGVRFYSENATAVSESKTKILSEMANNEILLFDPAILSSAQNIDVMLAKEAVYNYISRPETEIMLSLDVLACRKSGVKNAHAVKPLDVGKIKFTSAREALGDVYVGLENTKEFKLLEGDYLSFDVLPVIGKYETLCGIGENEGIFVHPLEINEKIDVYSGLADGFCSFALKDVKKIAYNKAELASVTEKYNYFRNRISNNNYVTCALYENPFHNKISKMTFAAGKNYRTYVVCGFVRATKKDSGETRFIPLCFVKAELELEGSYKLKITDKEPIMNPLLLSYISSGEVDASAVKNAYDAASYVERLILKNKPSLEKNFSKTEVVREAALVNADFSPVYLWRNIKAYGKKYLNSGLVNAYLSGKTLAKYEEPAREYVFSHYVDNLLEEKLLSFDSLVVSGDGDVSSKIAIVSDKIAYNAFAGKKTLLVSSDEGFVSETENNLKELGLSALVLKPESTSSEEIVSRMREKIDEVGREYTLNRLRKIPDDYKSTKKALSDYSDSVISSANEFGMSLSDAAESYIGANTGIENEAVLETDKKAFEGENALNDMFGIAEELIVEAEKALKDAGLEKYEPVSRHPLFAVRKNVKTDERLEKGFDVIDKIISILSDYRESFLEIEDEINIGISEIKTQKALMALNELYKTVISARELDIPSGFTENDISVFADNSENLAKAKDRLENIEFQLRFMNKEIFEDVDILLSDFSYNDGHNENFIKKYLIKKNNKDVLLQYVSPENRPEFNQHGIEGVYRLLSEYRKIRLSLDGYKNKVEYSENNVKLANFIKNVETELKNIYPDASGEFINKKTRKIFDFIEKVAKKPSVSKSLTYARASLTEVFSENDCLIKVLSETLNVDFEDFVFD
ncbi:MAG: hypothetical protein K6D98_06400, partial [Clostridiales bacterium]|nr:hypothetical protein [Clostridiales bacterium]